MAMEKNKKDIVRILLKQNLEERDEADLLEMLVDNPLSVDVDKQEEDELTTGQKAADKISEVAGSWGFILGFVAFLVFWIILNGLLLKSGAMDPYPFILLNLMLSCLAAIQAPIIMMSQNRQSEKDRCRSQNDYRINLKNELITEMLHHQLETVIKNQSKILTYLGEIKEDTDDDNNDSIENTIIINSDNPDKNIVIKKDIKDKEDN